jgi:hypothetical protein
MKTDTPPHSLQEAIFRWPFGRVSCKELQEAEATALPKGANKTQQNQMRYFLRIKIRMKNVQIKQQQPSPHQGCVDKPLKLIFMLFFYDQIHLLFLRSLN